MKQDFVPSSGLNRAKPYQLVLFPLNSGTTNVYYVLILPYVTTFGSAVLGFVIAFVSIMVTTMRVLDAVTDSITSALMDKTNGKFDKSRPFMVSGSVIMAASVICLYVLTLFVPTNMVWLRYVPFVVFYAIRVIGYACQILMTRAAQSVLTNDPKQRSLFTVFNTTDFLLGMGVIQFPSPILAGDGMLGDYNQTWSAVMTPIRVVVSVVPTILAIIGIWEKDQPKCFGITGEKTEKVKTSEYWEIIEHNNPIQRLMVAGAGCKLALSIATNTTVPIMFYGCMMGNYDNLYLPMMILGHVFTVPFFLLTVRTAQKRDQKASLVRYVGVALVCYVGVLVLLLLWKQGGPALNFSIYEGTLFRSDFRISTNLYTVLFILFSGIGYGAYYAMANMPIPIVTDRADYETYRSGKLIPDVMDTLFALVSKLASSLGVAVVGPAVSFAGLDVLPTRSAPYVPGMNIVVTILFCIIPMAAWLATSITMREYTFTRERMRQIQAMNSVRKEAVAKGMSPEEVMRIITDEAVPK